MRPAKSRRQAVYNEGEFASLREGVDVLLVGASGALSAKPGHGERPANPCRAALLGRRCDAFRIGE